VVDTRIWECERGPNRSSPRIHPPDVVQDVLKGQYPACIGCRESGQAELNWSLLNKFLSSKPPFEPYPLHYAADLS
jgi:hypothetical protein